jgi:hypothetical protein
MISIIITSTNMVTNMLTNMVTTIMRGTMDQRLGT